MKLSYNVLCIDDQLPTLRRNKNIFRDLNDDVGIEVAYHDINAAAGPTETEKADYLARLKAEIDSAYEQTTFDLILIDLHLNNDVEGHELIEFIRDKHSIYRPVIFYSAGQNPESEAQARAQLEEAATKSGVNGRNVLLTPRQGINALLQEIASEMHREEHKINQVRGLLMDRVSELEANIIRALTNDATWDALGGDGKKKLFDYVQKNVVTKRFKEATKLHDKMKEMDIDGIKNLVVERPQTFDAYNRARLLKSMLEFIGGMEAQVAALEHFVSAEGLNDVRNKYAHRTTADLGADHTDERCIEIRRGARDQLKSIGEVLFTLKIA
ncbi:response regulator [Sinorhizobium meliloti]|nr:response regulator [Sinorhizobium meliloti]